MEHLLVQRILIDDQEIDLSLMVSFTYIETLFLDGPKYIIKFNDLEELIRDDLGLVEGVTLTITLQDLHIQGGLNIEEDVKIRSVTVNDQGVLVAQGFPIYVDNAKKPLEKTRFMVGHPVQSIAAAIMPQAQLNIDPFPIVEQFHLLGGDRPTRSFRRLSLELGAAIYYNRGTLNIKSLKGLFEQPVQETYHHNNESEEFKILAYKSLYRSELLEEMIFRNYTGWNIIDGIITSTKNNRMPVEIMPVNSIPQLDNRNWTIVPVIDFGTIGYGALKPGIKLGIKFHRAREGRPFDESLPEEVITYLVAHHYEASRYTCRVKAGVVIDERE